MNARPPGPGVAWLLFSAALGAQTGTGHGPREMFDDVTAFAGIEFVHRSGATPNKRMVETFGSGAAWLDYDGDGSQDLFLVNGDYGSANALYRNNGDGTFTDVARQAGVAGETDKTAYKTGVAVGDVDNDGDLDLYVTAFGPNTLYRNNGDGTFTDVTTTAGVGGGREWSTSTGFFDAEGDGDLDLYVVNYLDIRPDDDRYCGFAGEGYRMYCNPTVFDGMADRLFFNRGDGTFTDGSAAAGIANPAGKGLGLAFCDFDGDHRPDIYVANDMVRNFLFRNNGDGTFHDATYSSGVGFDPDGKPQAGMGTDCADVDGDARPDVFVTNFSQELNTLYGNRGNGLFEDVTVAAGLRSGYDPLGFGTKLFDLDNDGDRDIYVANGHVIDNVALYDPKSSYAQRDLVYENLGGGRFLDISDTGGQALQLRRVGRGLAVADYDNDGTLDVLVHHLGEAPVLLKNRGVPGQSWIAIQAKGRRSNRFGLGTHVTIETSAGRQVGEVNNVASYLSANDIRLHFGLGQVRTIRRIDVRWPSGATQVLRDVAANQILVVEEP